MFGLSQSIGLGNGIVQSSKSPLEFETPYTYKKYVFLKEQFGKYLVKSSYGALHGFLVGCQQEEIFV